MFILIIIIKKNDSTALTTTHKIYNRTNNPKIKEFAKEIIDTQEREIQLMKSML